MNNSLKHDLMENKRVYKISYTKDDVATFYYIKNKLNFTFEQMDLLMEYCNEIGNLSSVFIKFVAKEWYKKDILNDNLRKEADESLSKIKKVLSVITLDEPLDYQKKKIIEEWYDEYKEEQILKACKLAEENEAAFSFKYISAILKNNKNKKYNKRNQFNNYQQSTTPETINELEKLFLYEVNNA